MFLQVGGDLIRYAHLKFGSIPEALCPTRSSPGPGLWPSQFARNDLSIPVSAGQFLGLVGNTGRTSNPHLHFHVEHIASGGPDTVSGAPMQFLNVRTLAHQAAVSFLGDDPALQPLHGLALHRNSLVLPNPCGFDLPPAGLAEVSRHGINAECYQDEFNLIVARGYRPVFVDGYDVGGQTFFNATFGPAGPASVARHGLDGEEYQQLFDELTGAGFRLHQVDSYLESGEVRYAAIFEVRPGPPFVAFHGLTDSEYETALDELGNAGFVPIQVSTVELAGERFWTALLEQVPTSSWMAETVPVSDYQETFDAHDALGRSLIYVHGFTGAGGAHLTGIWVDPVEGSRRAVHGLSSDDYQAAYDSNRDAGRFTRYTTGYDDGAGSHRFAALWRGRPDTVFSQTPPAVTNQTTAHFSFAADNPFTTFECRLDLLGFGPCASPSTLTGLSEGLHLYQARAVDRELIRDASPAAFLWLVDLTPPQVVIVAPVVDTKTVHGELKEGEENLVEATTVVGWADVIADATDALSGVASVEFKVNGMSRAGTMVDADTWKFEFVPDLKGEQLYNIEVVATDHAGNASTASTSIVGIRTGKSP